MRTAKLILHTFVAVAMVFYTLAFALLAVPSAAQAQVPTSIGYNGRLFNSSGTALTGTYYFWFDLESALTGGTTASSNIQGTNFLATPTSAITVTNGFFSLQIPLGASLSDFSDNLFLELKVNSSDAVGSAETLSPRVEVTKTPYSIFTQAIEAVSSAPTDDTFDGRLFYDTTNDKIRFYDGDSWNFVEGITDTATLTLDNSAATAINIGAGAVAKTVTVGNSTGATSVVLNAGTGALNIGTNAIAHTVTVGNTTGATAVQINTGTGGFGVDGPEFDITPGTGAITIDDGGNAGAILVEGTNLDINDLTFVGAGTVASAAASALNITSGTTGAVTVDSGSTGAVNLGTGAAAKTITMGNAASTESEINALLVDINGGTGGVTIDGGAASNFSTSVGGLTLSTSAGGTSSTVVLRSLDTTTLASDPTGVAIYLDADGAAGSGIELDAYDATNNTTGAIGLDAAYVQINTNNSAGPGSAGLDVNVAGAGTIAMDTTDGAISVTAGGSGGSVAVTSAQNDVSLDTQTASRTITIGSTSVARTINMGTGTGADVMNFGTQSAGSLDMFNFFSSETTNDTMDIFFDSVTTANGIDYTVDGLTSGNGFYLTHTGTMSGALWRTETTGAWTGTIYDFDDTGNAAWTGNIYDIDTGTGNASGNVYDLNIEDSTNDDVQAFVIANASQSDQAGWLMDVDTSAAWTSNAIDFTTGAQAWTGNVMDFNFGNAAATGDVININNPALAVATQSLVIDNAAASTVDGWIAEINATGAFTGTGIDVDTTAAFTGNVIDVTTATAASSGNLIDLNFGNIADTGDAVNVSMGAAAVGAQAFVTTTSAGVRTAAAIQITENNTTGTVPSIQWDSAETRGGLLDANITGALGTENLIDLTVSAAFSSNLLDLNNTSTGAGNIIDVNVTGASSGEAFTFDSTNDSAYTGNIIDVDTGTGNSTSNLIDLNIEDSANDDVQAIVINAAGALDAGLSAADAANTGWLLAATGTGAFTTNMLDLNTSGAATGDVINIALGATSVGTQAFVTTTSAGVRTAAAIQITENNTTGTVPSIQWDSAETRGGLLDANITGALGTENLIDLTVSAAFSSNLLDLNNTSTGAGNIIDVNVTGASSGEAFTFDSTNDSAYTGNIIDVDTGTGNSTSNLIDLNIEDSANDDVQAIVINAAGALDAGLSAADAANTGWLLAATGTGVFTANMIDLNSSSTGSGNIIDVDFSGASTGEAFSVKSSNNSAFTGNLFDVDTGTGNSTTNIIDLNIGDSGNDDVQAIVVNAAGALDAAAPASGTGWLIAATGSGAFTADMIDLNSSSTSSGNIIDIALTGTSTGHGIFIDNDAQAATGHLFYIDSDADRSSTSLFRLDDQADATASAPMMDINVQNITDENVFDIDLAAAVVGNAIKVDSTLDSAYTGNIIDVDTGTGNSTSNLIDLNIEDSANDDVQAIVINAAGALDAGLSAADAANTGWLLAATGTGVFTANMIDLNSSSTGSGNIIDVDFSGASTGEAFSVKSSNNSAFTGNLFDVDTGTGNSTTNIIDLNIGDSANDDVQAIVVNAAGALDAGLSAANAANTGWLIAATGTGSFTANMIDLNVNSAASGDVIDIDFTASVTGKGFSFDSSTNNAYTGNIIDMDTGTGNATANLVDLFIEDSANDDVQAIVINADGALDAGLSAADAANTGWLLAATGTGVFTANMIDLNSSSTGSGNIIDVDFSGASTGEAFSVKSSNNSAFTGNLFDVDTGTGNSTTNIIDLNIGDSANDDVQAIVVNAAGALDAGLSAADAPNTGWLLAATGTGVFTANMIDLNVSNANSTGDIFDIKTNATGSKVLDVSSTGTITTDAINLSVTGSSITRGVDALNLSYTIGDGANVTNSGISISLATNGTGSGDVATGLYLTLTGTDDTDTTKAIKIDNGDVWDEDIEFQNAEYISNSINAELSFQGTGGTTTDVRFDLDGAAGPVIDSVTHATVQINDFLIIDAPANTSTQRLCANTGGGDGIALNNSTVVDCSNAGQADFAEMYPVAEGVTYGDIVVPGSQSVTTKQGDSIVQLVKSSETYQGPVSGIVSDNYEDGTSAGYNIADSDNPMPIALVGRVPVNVTDENGSIAVGDFITTSSTAGKGMKATEAGRVIGMALSSFSGSEGQVMVQVVNTWYQPDSGVSISDSSSDSSSVSVSDGNFSGSVTIAEHLYGSQDMAGRVRLASGKSSVRVTFETEYDFLPIVTFSSRSNSDSADGAWISDEDTTGFTINRPNSEAQVEFNWIAIGVEDAQVTVSDDNSEGTAVSVTDVNGVSAPAPEATEEEATSSEEAPAEEPAAEAAL